MLLLDPFFFFFFPPDYFCRGGKKGGRALSCWNTPHVKFTRGQPPLLCSTSRAVIFFKLKRIHGIINTRVEKIVVWRDIGSLFLSLVNQMNLQINQSASVISFGCSKLLFLYSSTGNLYYILKYIIHSNSDLNESLCAEYKLCT